MGRIEWSEELSVGVPELDAQHQRWIEMINELHDTLLTGSTGDLLEVTSKMLQAMADYADKHFSTEEAYMEKIGYAGLEDHRDIHRRFSARIHQHLADMEEGFPILNSQLMKELMNWLTGHILAEDKRYSNQ